MREPTIRPFHEGDEPGIQAVIKGVFDEYGFTWEPEGYNRDSLDVREFYHDQGGGFWVMELDGIVIGTVGLKARRDGRCELYRLYLPAQHRGKGHGRDLYVFAQEAAREAGFTEMEIWSDKKLAAAHGMYTRSGAEPLGERICDDPDNSEEVGFLLKL
ncbi:MAG: GNAT family N-acetyltransferase [Armatimonadetes bacterium]|nr:GNAT family N-acetyltransferase [Armatimonadota bacterium]